MIDMLELINSTNDSANIKYCSAGSKRRYPNEKKAKWALHQQRNWGARVCRVYECPLCAGWHLTSTEEDVKKVRKRRKERRVMNCKGIRGSQGVDWHTSYSDL